MSPESPILKSAWAEGFKETPVPEAQAPTGSADPGQVRRVPGICVQGHLGPLLPLWVTSRELGGSRRAPIAQPSLGSASFLGAGPRHTMRVPLVGGAELAPWSPHPQPPPVVPGRGLSCLGTCCHPCTGW